MYLQPPHLRVIERLKETFQDDPRYLAFERGLVRFMQDTEWNWLDNQAPLQDW